MVDFTNRKWNLIISISIILVFGLIIAGFAFNRAMLRKALVKDLTQHTTIASEQQANLFSRQIQTDLYFIEEFSHLMRDVAPERWTESMLNEKKYILGMDELFLIHKAGQALPSGFDDEFLKEMVNDFDLWTSPGVTYLGDGQILYLVPITYNNQPKEYILAGAKKFSSFQHLESSYSNTDVFLADENGQIISHVVGKDEYTPEEEAFYKRIESKMRNQKFFAKLVSQKSMMFLDKLNADEYVIITTHPLLVNGWVQLSLLSWDLGTEHVHHERVYLALSLTFTVISIVMVILLLFINKRIKKQWNDMICRDFVTGGITNVAFQKQYIEQVNQKYIAKHAIVFLNVCDFKNINETWGGEAGDQILRYISQCLIKNLNNDELVTRSETDHFFLLLHEDDEMLIRNRIGRLIQVINSGLSFFSIPYYPLSFMVGGYMVDTYEEIQTAQDRARRAAEFNRTTNLCVFYDESIQDKIQREKRLDALFYSSIENRDFQIYLQPKVYLNKKQLCAAEALVRWIHPEEGVIYPDEFIPLFEENGKIGELDLYVFEEVCKLMKEWKEKNHPITQISVNVSKNQIKDMNNNFLEKYCEIKEKYGVQDGVIQLELTETSMLQACQFPYVISMIKRIHKAGFLCALDDFGFGYSSLSMLHEFDVDTIKLDKSFFMNESEKSQIVVEHMIRLAHAMGMELVAEGIEDQQQVSRLCHLGCDLIQGYFFSKPLPVKEFEVWQCSNERANPQTIIYP